MKGAALFDLDGTLADSAPDLIAAVNRLLTEEGQAPMPLTALRSAVSGGARALLQRAFGLSPQADAYVTLERRFLDHYRAALCVRTRLFAGIDDCLLRLEAQGIPWGIITNKRRQFTTGVVAGLKLTERAACVICGDDVSQPKPAPDALLRACALIGVEPADCFYLGDDLRDIEAAHRAGMRGFVAAWGYLGESAPADWGADGIIHNPTELIGL